MILRRITTALKRQDWVTVFIELALVIAGVLIALQIDNWNTAHQDRIDEAYYLGRILDDIDESIANNEHAIVFLSQRAERSAWVVRKLREGSLTKAEEDVFNERFNDIGRWLSGDFIDGTIDELRSSGRLGIIQSKSFREHLTRFELSLAAIMRGQANIADYFKALELEIIPRVDSTRDGDTKILLSSFEELASDKELIRYLDRYAAFYAVRLSLVRDLQRELKLLREQTLAAKSEKK